MLKSYKFCFHKLLVFHSPYNSVFGLLIFPKVWYKHLVKRRLPRTKNLTTIYFLNSKIYFFVKTNQRKSQIPLA